MHIYTLIPMSVFDMCTFIVTGLLICRLCSCCRCFLLLILPLWLLFCCGVYIDVLIIWVHTASVGHSSSEHLYICCEAIVQWKE